MLCAWADLMLHQLFPKSVATVHSSAFLSAPSCPLNLALIVLNVESSIQDSQKSAAARRFSHLWQQSSLRVCADGAANRLHDSLSDSARDQMLPDLIMGDLDSLRPDVESYYRERGVSIVSEDEQDSHDFEKCLRWLERRQQQQAVEAAAITGGRTVGGGSFDGDDSHGRSSSGSSSSFESSGSSDSTDSSIEPFHVVAYGAFGGRLDHLMANLNMAYRFDCFESFYLMSDESLAMLLSPGAHTIEVNRHVEDGSCGLIPLGRSCERVLTAGLKWDLDGKRPLEFGSLISSSNWMVDERIAVETDAPLLWTTGLHQRSKDTK